MKNTIKTLSVITVLALLLASCKKDKNDATTTLTLNLAGLEDLGANARYEGWIMVNGSPVTTGVFSVNATGQLSQTAFQIDRQQLQNATAFIYFNRRTFS